MDAAYSLVPRPSATRFYMAAWRNIGEFFFNGCGINLGMENLGTWLAYMCSSILKGIAWFLVVTATGLHKCGEEVAGEGSPGVVSEHQRTDSFRGGCARRLQ